MLAQPIDVVNQRQNAVQYLGEGFAPYYIPIGLFVGAVALFLFLAPVSRRLLDFGFAPIKAALSGWTLPSCSPWGRSPWWLSSSSCSA